MSEIGDAIEEVREALAESASEFLPGTCTLIAPVKADDGFSGHTISDSELATSIPCRVDFVSGGAQVNVSGVMVIKSHRITLPVNPETLAIDGHYKIKIDAEGSTPEMIFDQPITQIDHMSPLLRVVASLTDGFKQPAMT